MGVSIDDLIDLVDELRTKLEIYSKDLGKSEALVRYSIIDPLLNALGWDTSDPAVVRPEFSTEKGRPDYALINSEGNPIAFVGAKALNKVEDLSQYITYCVAEGVPYFIATDGSKWELYHTFKQAKTPEKKIIEWNLLLDKTPEIVIKALSIARPLEFQARAPNLLLKGEKESFSEPEVENRVATTVTSSGEFKLSESTKKKSPWRPEQLEIGGTDYEVRYSKDVLIKTGEWLIDLGKLSVSDCPIESGGKRYIVNSKPMHKDGKDFVMPFQLRNGVWIELHNSAERGEKLAKDLLTHFKFPAEILKVKWRRG